MIINIAIDGPAGAGKSTLAKQAAQAIGFVYVDTGALYRAIGLKALRLQLEDDAAIGQMAGQTEVTIAYAEDGQQIFLDGENVTGLIRTPAVSMAASRVSAIGAVRSRLLELQRSIAKENHCLMDGRDIGTVVLPSAQIKIFLTADVEARAQRRYLQLQEKGESAAFEAVLAEMQQRDYQDSHREIAPLRPAKDSILLDTTNLSLEESFEALVGVINEKIGQLSAGAEGVSCSIE